MKPVVRRALTRIELWAFIAMIAIQAAMLLPALSRARFRAKCISCTSIYRQGGPTTIMDAGDDAKGKYPSFIAPGSGRNPWDVSTNMDFALGNHNLTKPVWFCPARLDHQGRPEQTLGHFIANQTDLAQAVFDKKSLRRVSLRLESAQKQRLPAPAHASRCCQYVCERALTTALQAARSWRERGADHVRPNPWI